MGVFPFAFLVIPRLKVFKIGFNFFFALKGEPSALWSGLDSEFTPVTCTWRLRLTLPSGRIGLGCIIMGGGGRGATSWVCFVVGGRGRPLILISCFGASCGKVGDLEEGEEPFPKGLLRVRVELVACGSAGMGRRGDRAFTLINELEEPEEEEEFPALGYTVPFI